MKDKKQNLDYRGLTILLHSRVDYPSENNTKNNPLFKTVLGSRQRFQAQVVSKNSAEGSGWIGEPSVGLESAGLRPSQARSDTLLESILSAGLTPGAANAVLTSASLRRELSMQGVLTWRSLQRLDLRRITLHDATILFGSVSSLTEVLLSLATLQVQSDYRPQD